MQDLGKPRTRRSDLDIFLDRSVQTPSPDLWRGILDNLDRSRFLDRALLPAGGGLGRRRPRGAALARHRPQPRRPARRARSTVRPRRRCPRRARLRDEGTYDPLFVDLRWVASARDLDGRTSSRFREDVATLLAPIRGVAKETLVDEELTVRERGIRVQRRFIVGLSAAVVVVAPARPGRDPPVAAGRQRGPDRRVPRPRRGCGQPARDRPGRGPTAGGGGLPARRQPGGPRHAAARHDRQPAPRALPRRGRADHRPDRVHRREHRGRGHRRRAGPAVGGGGGRAAARPPGPDRKGHGRGRRRGWRHGGRHRRERRARLERRGTGRAGRPRAVGRGRPRSGSPRAAGGWSSRCGTRPRSTRACSRSSTAPAPCPSRRLPVGLSVSTVVLPDEDEVVALNGTGLWQRLRLSTGATLGASLAGVAGAHDFADAVAPDGAHYAWTNGDTQIPVWRTDHPADYGACPTSRPRRPAARPKPSPWRPAASSWRSPTRGTSRSRAPAPRPPSPGARPP